MTQSMGRHSDATRPPRLVLRFALYVALALVLAAAGTLVFVRHYTTARAERDAGFHARYIAGTILRERLRPSDFSRPVTGPRLAALDRLFRRQVLVEGALRVKLYSPGGRTTYSTDHLLIGTVPEEGEALEALSGETVTSVSRLNHEGGGGKDLKVLEAYAPVRLGAGKVGVFELYQDYAPIAREARETFVPIAGVLGAALLLLCAALFPILRRATTRLRRQMEEIEHQALHDGLTDLPNRTLFRDRVAQALLEERRNPRGFAVMLIDLDRFKEINDALGHESGDLLLREVGQRLREVLRATDTVARLGGDEFAVVAQGVGDSAAAETVAAKLRNALTLPFPSRGLLLEVEASIGISLFPEHGTEVDTLIRHADVAMYLAKGTHSGAEVYNADRDEYSPDRLKLMGELRQALGRRELVLYYQPKISLRTAEVLGFEALVRWQHPERGLLGPDRFIPIAEHTGLIRPLTRYVLEAALRQCRQWQLQGLEVAVAVNLSSRDVLDLHLPDEVAALLERWQIEPSRLELEITENVILGDPLRTRAILERLKELGVRVAIDDFGSGYSSLGYLKRLPLDVIKIDKSFVLNIGQEDDAAIVRSTIELAHNLGLEVVAEGVETEEARAALAALRCDTAQGYLFSRPLPTAEVPGWLNEVSQTSWGRPATRLGRRESSAGSAA